MPARASVLRLVALVAFLVAVAAGLWLYGADWPVVVVVMAAALAIAWTVEWLAWREERPEPPFSAREQAAPRPQEDEEGAAEPPAPDAASPPAEPEAEKRPAAVPAPPPPAPPRPRLVPQPPPPAPREPAPGPEPRPAEGAPVVGLETRRSGPREWNLWELERLARAEAHRRPERSREWAYLFVHLRQFANADGALPREFDALVRESFGDLLDAAGRT